MKRATLNECYRHADELLSLMRQGGFVLLAKGQDVPENPYKLDEGLYRSGQFIGYRDAQVDMYRAGWRKIALEANESDHKSDSGPGVLQANDAI